MNLKIADPFFFVMGHHISDFIDLKNSWQCIMELVKDVSAHGDPW